MSLTQIAIVTGGNSGVGLETVKVLVNKGASVYIGARSETKARKAIAEILKECQSREKLEFIPLDLASFRSIEEFVKNFSSRESRLDMLFNNAGVLMPDSEGKKTEEGCEIHMGVNALGVYYLTLLLIPSLRKAHEAHPSLPARVCFTSSGAQSSATKKGFDTDDVSGANIRFNLTPKYFQAYANSKIVVIMGMLRAYTVARVLQRRYSKEGIVFNACNPGNLKSDLLREVKGPMTLVLKYFLEPLLLYPTPLGALTQLYANTSAEAAKKGGIYYVPWAREGRSAPAAEDPKIQEKGRNFLSDAAIAYLDEFVNKYAQPI